MLLACRELTKTFVAAPVLSGGYFHIEEKENGDKYTPAMNPFLGGN